MVEDGGLLVRLVVVLRTEDEVAYEGITNDPTRLGRGFAGKKDR